jgi:hypothetical protein
MGSSGSHNAHVDVSQAACNHDHHAHLRKLRSAQLYSLLEQALMKNEEQLVERPERASETRLLQQAIAMLQSMRSSKRGGQCDETAIDLDRPFDKNTTSLLLLCYYSWWWTTQPLYLKITEMVRPLLVLHVDCSR